MIFPWPHALQLWSANESGFQVLATFKHLISEIVFLPLMP